MERNQSNADDSEEQHGVTGVSGYAACVEAR